MRTAHVIRTAVLSLLLVLSAASVAPAQDWAEKMFTTGLEYDFGAVARGAKVEHRFVIKNLYVEDVHVSGVRSSCGCTTPRVEQETLKTHEETAVVAHFNTDTFLGTRSATLTVTFDKPYYAQVQLRVKGYIRSDIVVTPDHIDFGSVDQGAAAEKSVEIAYAGRGDWQITGVRSGSEHLQAEVVETRRTGSEVSYRLDARLSADAPAGTLHEELTLLTNDRRATQFPICVEGRVTAALTVSPASVLLGSLQPGQQVTKQIVLQAKRPFRIVEIRCDDQGFEFRHTDEAKPVHLVPIVYTAGTSAGKITHQIHIVTDLDAAGCDVPAYVQIVEVTAKN